MNLDLSINLWLYHTLDNPIIQKTLVFFTYLGDNGIFWITLIILLLISKNTRYLGFVMLIGLILDFTSTSVIKLIVNRLRPYEAHNLKLLISAPSGSSFPSIHASTAFVCSWIYFLLARKKPYSFFRWPILIIAVIISISRIYLLVHYPSDVIAGALIGILIAYLAIYLCQYLLKMGRLEFLHIDPYNTVYLKYPFRRKQK